MRYWHCEPVALSVPFAEAACWHLFPQLRFHRQSRKGRVGLQTVVGCGQEYCGSVRERQPVVGRSTFNAVGRCLLSGHRAGCVTVASADWGGNTTTTWSLSTVVPATTHGSGTPVAAAERQSNITTTDSYTVSSAAGAPTEARSRRRVSKAGRGGVAARPVL